MAKFVYENGWDRVRPRGHYVDGMYMQTFYLSIHRATLTLDSQMTGIVFQHDRTVYDMHKVVREWRLYG